jgi:fucose permease
MSTAAPLPARRTGIALGVICAAFFAAGFAIAAFGPVLPALSARTGGSLYGVGWIMNLNFAGSLVAQFIVGWGGHRFGRRLAIALGLALVGGCAAVVGASHALWLSLAIAVPMGIGYGGSTLSGNVLSSEIVPARRAFAVNLVNAFYGIGAIAGPLAVSVLLARTGEAVAALWIGALLLGACALASALLLPDLGPAKIRPGAAPRTVSITDPLLITCGLFTLVYVGSEIGVGTWASLYLQRTAGLDAAESAAATSVFWAALTFGRLAATVAGMRLDAEHLLTASVWIASAGAALLWAGHGSAALSVAAYAVIGAGFGPIYPTAVAVVTSAFPHAGGEATSRMGLLAAIGGMTLPLLHSLVITHRPPRDHALLTLAMAIAMIVIWGRVRRLAHAHPA